MAVHRLDEGDGIYFQATITFDDERVQPNNVSFPMWNRLVVRVGIEQTLQHFLGFRQ